MKNEKNVDFEEGKQIKTGQEAQPTELEWASKLEELEKTKDEGLLVRLLNMVQGKLEKRSKDLEAIRREKEWQASPEGKLWEAQMASHRELMAQDNQRAEAVREARLLEARRQLALQLLADELLKTKFKITRDDKRLLPILQQIAEVREVISNAYYAKG